MRSIESYIELLKTAQIIPSWQERLAEVRDHLLSLKPRYEGFGVPWELLAVLHMRECSNDFNRQILNGEPWKQMTTLIPKGLGPFESWRDAMWYAIVHHKINLLEENDLPEIMQFLEGWNGFGYFNKGKQSPYVWTGSNHGIGTGRYMADNTYDETAVDAQPGAGVMFLILTGRLQLEDSIIKIGNRGPNVQKLQEFLN